jgi:hypothetical protein
VDRYHDRLPWLLAIEWFCVVFYILELVLLLRDLGCVRFIRGKVCVNSSTRRPVIWLIVSSLIGPERVANFLVVLVLLGDLVCFSILRLFIPSVIAATRLCV